MPAKFVDYSGYAVAFAANVSDVGKGADAIKKLSIKVSVDSGKGADAYGRMVSWCRAYADSGKGTDAVRRLMAKVYGDSWKGVDAYGRVVSWLRSVFDSGRGLEAIAKVLLKKYADTFKGADVLGRVVLWYRSLIDSGKGIDAYGRIVGWRRAYADSALMMERLCKGVAPLRGDVAVSYDWAIKGRLVSIEADTEVWGWISSASLRNFRDSGVSSDYMCRLPAKKLVESVHGVDWLRRVLSVRLAEAVIGVERFVKSALKIYADSYVGSDRMVRCVGKPFLDYSTVADYLYRTAFWVRSAVESVKGVERFGRDVLKRMVDSSVLAERLIKVPVRVLADVARLIDSFGKSYQIVIEVDTVTSGWASVASAKVLRDSGVSGDYMCKEPMKRLVEAVYGVDWWYKFVGKRLADAVLGLDWYGKFLLRHFADAGLSLDYVRRGVVKPVWDYPYVHEYLFKWVARMMPILESVVCSDWYRKDVLRHFADASLGVDRVRKEPSKALFDLGLVLELFQIAGWLYVELRDFLVGEHVPVKDVTSCKADANMSVDFLAKDVLKPYIDAVVAADYVRRLGLKVLADAGVGLDFAARTPSKALADAGLLVDWCSKDVMRNFLEWAVGVDWVILPALKLVVLMDWVVGEHMPVKDVGKVGVESVASVDWKSFDLTSCLIDAVRGLDGVYRYFPVELRDYLFTDYDVGFGRIWTIKDRAKMEELVAKLGFTLMGQEVWRRVYHRVWYDLIEVADQNTKIVIAQALIDTFKALYDKLKG
jgi:hypothetical protein